MSSITALLPKWTKRVSIEDSGRDPLGLSRVSVTVADYLLRGIITQTYRARYYSFYCWAVWHIDTTEPATSLSDYRDKFQRLDTFFALASLEANKDAHPVGILVARIKLSEAKSKGEVDCSFRVLPSNPLGAFGQYYQGSISQLGLLQTDERGVHHVTESGEAIARTFHESVAETPYIRNGSYLQSTVPWRDFVESCHSFELDGLAAAEKERELLIDVFFREGLEHKASPLRAYSLTAFLLLVETYAPLNGESVEGSPWKLIYAPCYYGQLILDDQSTREFCFPTELQPCSEHWQLFCAHQFFTMALEYILTAVLDLASEEFVGMALDEICRRLTAQEFFHELTDLHNGGTCLRPRDLLDKVGASSPLPIRETSLQNQHAFRLDSQLSEWSMLDRDSETPSRRTAIALSILTMLYAKWSGMNQGLAASIREESLGELTMWRAFPYINGWFSEQATWESVLKPIIEDFVIDQHDRVMYGKGKLESCWLHLDKGTGRVVKDQDYSPVYRSSRCENATSILIDLGLLQRTTEKNVLITNRGAEVLRKVLR